MEFCRALIKITRQRHEAASCQVPCPQH